MIVRLAFFAALAAGVSASAAVAAQPRGCAQVVQLVSAPYEEQICSRGPQGYAVCRWVRRDYVAQVPLGCAADVEQTRSIAQPKVRTRTAR